jgi:hypothetical protein
MLLCFALPSHVCSPIIYEILYVNLYGYKLSHRGPGAHCDDLLNLINNWIKNIVASGFFLVTLFLAAEEKVTGSKGFESKPARTRVPVRA